MEPINRSELMKVVGTQWGNVLVDKDVDLPVTQLIIAELMPRIASGENFAILTLSIESIIDLEKIYGYDKYDAILIHVAKLIKSLSGDAIRNEDIITLEQVKSNHFIILLSSPRGLERFYPENLEDILNRVTEKVRSKLNEVDEIPGTFLKVSAGYSIISTNPLVRPERSIYRAIGDARRMAQHRGERQQMMYREELKKIIMIGEISTVFHPIVRISDLIIIGYEALTRGPKNTKMESPAVLFSVAQNNDLVEDLDRICKIKSLLNFQLNTTQAKREGRSISELKLFLNTEPQTFHDPYFTADKLEELINSHGIENSNLVLEITERSAISNYLEFRGILKAFRDKGFLIAIDDAGSGYSSLQAIVELEPDFVKIDMALIRDIDQDKIKQGLISALVKFSLENRIPMIAEGVETIEEYDQLVDMGVQYAQGFYFARPLPELLKSDNIVIV